MAPKKLRAFKEAFVRLLEAPIDPETAGRLDEQLRELPPGFKTSEAIAMAQIGKALRGDTAAAKYIGELMSEETSAPPEVRVTVRVIDDGA